MTYNTKTSNINIFLPVKWFLFLFLLINSVKTRENVFFLIRTFIWITFLSSIVAILQFVLFRFTGIILLRRQDFVSMRLRFEDTTFGTFFRPSGFFDHIHILSIVVTIALLILLFLYFSRNYSIVGKNKTILMIGTMLLAIVLTLYKAIWIAIFISVIVMIYVLKPSKSIHITAVLMVIFLCLYATGLMNEANEIISNEIRTGIEARYQLARLGIQKFTLHPFFGIGLYQGSLYTNNAFNLPAHNALILIADELGIFGLLTLISLYGFLFLRLVFLSIQSRDIDSKTLYKALSVTFIAFLIYVQFEPTAYMYMSWVYFGLIESSIQFANKL
jgi:hypothetical protein